MQHTELSASLAKDVLDPLQRLKEGGEAVHKLSAQTKQAAKDMKAAYERCRKLYSRYVQLHNKAVGACASAGVPAPPMWIPPGAGDGGSGTSPSASGAPAGASGSPGGAYLVGNGSPARGSGASAGLAGLSRAPSMADSDTARSIAAAAYSAGGGGAMAPGGGARRRPTLTGGAGAAASSTTVDGTSPSASASARSLSSSSAAAADPSHASPVPTRAAGSLVSPPPTVMAGSIVTADGGEVLVRLEGPSRASGGGDATGIAPSSSSTSSSPDAAAGTGVAASAGSGASRGSAMVGLDSDESVVVAPPLPPRRQASARGVGLSAAAAAAAPSSLAMTPPSAPAASKTGGSGSGGASGAYGLADMSDAASVEAEAMDDASSVPDVTFGSLSAAGGGGPGGGAGADRRRSVDEGSESSFASLSDPNASFADRIRSMASGLIGSAMAVPPTTAAASAMANMTTEERIAALRAAAAAAVAAAEEAWRECQDAWAQHARAKEAFHKQLTASVVIFTEIEKKRVAELSDSLRKYAVFISSLHANLQYDVQRLSAKVELVTDAPATTLTALAAWKEQQLEQDAPPSPASSAGATGPGTPTFVPAGATLTPAPGGGSFVQTLRRASTLELGPSRTLSLASAGMGAGAPPLSGGAGGSSLASMSSAAAAASAGGSVASASAIAVAASAAGASAAMSSGSLMERAASGRNLTTGAVAADSPSSALSPQSLSRIGSRMMSAMPSVSVAMPGMPSLTGVHVGSIAGLAGYAGGTTAGVGGHEGGSAAGADGGGAGHSAAPAGEGAADGHPPAHPPSAGSTGGNGSMSRIFGARGSTRPLHSSPLVPKAAQPPPAPGSVGGAPVSENAAGAHAHTPERASPPDMTSPSSTTSSSGHLGAMMKGMLGSFGIGGPGSKSSSSAAPQGPSLSSSSSSSTASSSSGHPPKYAGGSAGKGQGVSVSVSVLGSVRNQGVAGVGSKGSKEVAAMMEHLRIERGPVEFLIEALFDPAGKVVKLAADNATVTVEVPAASSSSSSGEAGEASSSGEAIPSLSLADFASGKSTPQSPVSARSRVGTNASEDGAAAAAGGGSGSGSSPAKDGGADTSSSSFVTPNKTATAAPSASSSSPTSAARMSAAVAVGDMNPAVLVLLPRARKILQSAPDGLSRLVQCLDARRGEGTSLTRPSFDALSSLLLIALNVAESRADFSRARALMVISQTFYCLVHANEDADAVDPAIRAAAAETPRPTSQPMPSPPSGSGAPSEFSIGGSAPGGGSASRTPDGPPAVPTSSSASPRAPSAGGAATSGGRATRLYLQVRVRDHPLWQNMLYWESAVYDSVGSEISKMSAAGAGAHHHAVGGGGGGGGAESKAEGAREQEVIFGQLGFFAYNMITFGVPEDG